MNETKIHIDIDVYFSNPFVPIDMIGREEVEPFLSPNDTYSKVALGDFYLFLTRAGLWQLNCEFSNVHTEETYKEQTSTPKSFVITGKNKGGT